MRLGAAASLAAGVPGMQLVPRAEARTVRVFAAAHHTLQAARILDSHAARDGTFVVRPVLNGDYALSVTCVRCVPSRASRPSQT